MMPASHLHDTCMTLAHCLPLPVVVMLASARAHVHSIKLTVEVAAGTGLLSEMRQQRVEQAIGRKGGRARSLPPKGRFLVVAVVVVVVEVVVVVVVVIVIEDSA